MFGNIELKIRIEDLENKLEWANDSKRHLIERLDVLTEKNTKEARDSVVAVDFLKMNAFAIERNTNNAGVPYTNIGYYTSDNVMKEWSIFTSQERHNELVKEFEQVKKLRGKL